MPNKPKGLSCKEDALSHQQSDDLWLACISSRDQFIVGCLLLARLRVSELAHLKRSWVNYDEDTITVLVMQYCDCWECTKKRNGEWLESAVWERFLNEILDPDFLDNIGQMGDRKKATAKRLQANINIAKTRLETLENAETKILRLYGAGVVDEKKLASECSRIKDEAAKVKDEIATNEKALADIQNPVDDNTKQVIKDFVKGVNVFGGKHKREVLEIMGTGISIDDDMVGITETLNPANSYYLIKNIEAGASKVSGGILENQPL